MRLYYIYVKMIGIILICISKIAYLRFCIEERSTWEEESFRHNGHYLDKMDMDEKYKNKPHAARKHL